MIERRRLQRSFGDGLIVSGANSRAEAAIAVGFPFGPAVAIFLRGGNPTAAKV